VEVDNANGNDNGNGNGNIDNGDGAAPAIVRVQIESEAGTTFSQEDLPANVGVQSAQGVRGIGRPVVSVQVVSSEGDCDFIDAQGQVIDFEASEGLVQIAVFVCEV
jgi:hypothetical protein